MTVAIDTNAYAELARGNTHVRSILEAADRVLVPAIVLGELHSGFALGSQRDRNRNTLSVFLSAPGVAVVPVDTAVAERYGELVRVLRKRGTPIPTNDVWIAATVLETGSRLLSFDSHFADVPGVMSIL